MTFTSFTFVITVYLQKEVKDDVPDILKVVIWCWAGLGLCHVCVWECSRVCITTVLQTGSATLATWGKCRKRERRAWNSIVFSHQWWGQRNGEQWAAQSSPKKRRKCSNWSHTKGQLCDRGEERQSRQMWGKFWVFPGNNDKPKAGARPEVQTDAMLGRRKAITPSTSPHSWLYLPLTSCACSIRGRLWSLGAMLADQGINIWFLPDSHADRCIFICRCSGLWRE